ncbi:2-hydroxyacid dehydrogenase [Fulvivirga sp. M361]|uniref:2-hydroxyacid dehydrogenase n=1 Tax=Fulvivirga sp. M361 TaxID=2594266 RepID=UPI00117A95BE|nr:2-hydroxyacid dehydrogenase [Fulvivirga sp. M361]TRX59911.1 2-hydroxyacid dehydrogenase [Fulvivirga sp. M361]
MKVAVYSTKPYDKTFFDAENSGHKCEITYFEDPLTEETAFYTSDFDAVCVFVNDQLDHTVIHQLAKNGIKLIALRCAGFNNVDLQAASDHGIAVVRVPAYSPYAVAEHALALIMTLNRKTHRSFNRVRESNFSLNGLIGFDLHGKTVGVIGTGKIGRIFSRIMLGLGCKVIAYDPFPDEGLQQSGIAYATLDELYLASDIISLQCPLTPETYHLINENSLQKMKNGVMLINTSRGGLIDTKILVKALKSGKIGYLGIDVYEQEEAIFFKDLSDQIVQDDLIMRLITFPNVLITSHQAFFTDTAMQNIASTSLGNITAFFNAGKIQNEVNPDWVKA